MLQLIFSKSARIVGTIQSGDRIVGRLHIEYLGSIRFKDTNAEHIKFDGHIKVAKGKENYMSRNAFLILSSTGEPFYYDSDGTGGRVVLENLGDRILITLPTRQRFVRYAEHLDFIYEQFFPIQEWLGIALDSLKSYTSSKHELRFFSVTLLCILPYMYSIKDSNPLSISNNLGRTILVDKNFLPLRIDMKETTIASSISFNSNE